MIEVLSTNKMLKVRNAMGYPVDHPNEKTKAFFKRHSISLTKRWSDPHNTHIWHLEFPTDRDEFLFRIAYSDVLCPLSNVM